jgi:hypothetical protein
MLQRFRVDRAVGALYLAIFAAGCGRQAPALVPATAAPVSAGQVRGWVEATRPTGYVLHRFKWLLRDERSSAGGSGSARLAAPDSLRFDVRGPLGAGAAAAVVIGDSAAWTEPENAIDRLVPSYPLMWAMFGVARLPGNGSKLRGLQEGATTMWQYASGADTVEYLRATGDKPRLVAEVRRAGKVVGRAETELSGEGDPLRSRLVVPSVPARLDITFDSSSVSGGFPAKIWFPPERHP